MGEPSFFSLVGALEQQENGISKANCFSTSRDEASRKIPSEKQNSTEKQYNSLRKSQHWCSLQFQAYLLKFLTNLTSK